MKMYILLLLRITVVFVLVQNRSVAGFIASHSLMSNQIRKGDDVFKTGGSRFILSMRYGDSLGVIVNSQFVFMNAPGKSTQFPSILNIRMNDNVSEPTGNSMEESRPVSLDDNRCLNASTAVLTTNAPNNGSNENCIDGDVLDYLGRTVSFMPPQTRDLLRRITYNYIYGTNDDIISLQDIASIIEEEHRSRDVPVQVLGGSTSNNSKNVVVFEADVTKTGEAFDELCAEILSLGALYQLPKEIIIELLSAPIHVPSSRTSTSSVIEYGNSLSSSSAIIKCRSAFAAVGWKGVVFPMGLAIRPKTKFRSVWTLAFLRNADRGKNANSKLLSQDALSNKANQGGILPLSWWHRTKTLRDIATISVQNAAKVRPPPRQLIDRRKYLNSLDAQLRQLSPTPKAIMASKAGPSLDLTTPSSVDSTPTTLPPLVAPTVGVPSSTATTRQFFFPDTERQWWQSVLSGKAFSNTIRIVRRVASQQYSALKRQGRAGLISYCAFNFLYYSVGILWQWPRMPILQSNPIPDLASSLPRLHQQHLTVATLLLRKFGKIFAYLYAFSQLLKVPKLCTAVGLAPFASKYLEMVKRRFSVNETAAAAMLVGLMVLVWVTLISIPILSEYASLQHIFYLEKQLIQVYGLQPV